MKISLLLGFLILSSISIGQVQETVTQENVNQQNFEVKKIGTEYSLEQIILVFSAVDFCGSYFESKRNLIALNDGSEIELKTKSELIANGLHFSDNCFLSDATLYHSAIWSISDSNRLMKGSNNDINVVEKRMRVSNNHGQ